MTGIWPSDTRCVVTLTFDLDGATLPLNWDPEAVNRPSVLSMSDFGPKVGVFRILDLLDEHGVKVTFFIPGYIAERNQDTVRRVLSRGHEVAHHGYMHEPPSTLDAPQEVEIMDKSIRILEGIIGERPLGYRAPSWDPSTRTLGLVAERGFVYDSSLMDDDAPYLLHTSNGWLVELPVHWAQDDFGYYAYNRGAGSMNTPENVYGAWKTEFDGAYKYGRLFMLTNHPQVTGRLAKIMVLDRLIRYMREHDGVEFMRCIDVARMVESGSGASGT